MPTPCAKAHGPEARDEEGAEGLARVEEEQPSLVLVALGVDSPLLQRRPQGMGVRRHEDRDDRIADAEPLGDVVGQQVYGVPGMVVEQDRVVP